jgi:hypothetical protein
MRTGLCGAVVGVLLAVAGCHPATSSSGWPANAKQDFIKGCESHSAHPKRCACAADTLEKSTPWPAYQAMTRASKGGTAPTPEFAKLVRTVDAQCAQAESPFQKPASVKPKVEPSHRGAPWK